MSYIKGPYYTDYPGTRLQFCCLKKNTSITHQVLSDIGDTLFITIWVSIVKLISTLRKDGLVEDLQRSRRPLIGCQNTKESKLWGGVSENKKFDILHNLQTVPQALDCSYKLFQYYSPNIPGPPSDLEHVLLYFG